MSINIDDTVSVLAIYSRKIILLIDLAININE